MPVSTESLLQEKRRLVKAAKRIRKTSVAKRRTTLATTPKRKAKTDWLTKPVKRYKLVGNKRRFAIPQARKPLIPITPSSGKLGVSHHVSGNVPGAAGITWIPVISSNVAAYAYSEEEETLWVAFLDSSFYAYYNVGPDVWLRFQGAPSKGRFIWVELRDRYAYEKLG